MTTWMKNLDWSIVLCAEVVWDRRGRTSETSEEALEDAEAVCSVRTVVLWAMHALGGVSWVPAVEGQGIVLEQWRRGG